MRLIDGEKLFEYLGDVPWTEFKKHKVLRAVYNAPTIDAEPVVRCKDCRHANECRKIVQYARNEQNTVSMGYLPIEWCSRGERREP